MKHRTTRRALECVVAALLFATIAGCWGGPKRLSRPSLNANRAAARAMELYDANGDGAIAGDELDASPALKAALPRIDLDKDGRITADELAARLKTYADSSVVLVGVASQVLIGGRAQPELQVNFVPEPFLGDGFPSATGYTADDGYVTPRMQEAPQGLPGVYMGLYTVEVTKPDGSVARFGAEVAPDLRDQTLTFDVR